MNKNSNPSTVSFDLIRLTKAKKEVDICSNTIRAYARQGLALYRMGKAVFFSRSELEAFIRQSGEIVRYRGPVMG